MVKVQHNRLPVCGGGVVFALFAVMFLLSGCSGGGETTAPTLGGNQNSTKALNTYPPPGRFLIGALELTLNLETEEAELTALRSLSIHYNASQMVLYNEAPCKGCLEEYSADYLPDINSVNVHMKILNDYEPHL